MTHIKNRIICRICIVSIAVLLIIGGKSMDKGILTALIGVGGLLSIDILANIRGWKKVSNQLGVDKKECSISTQIGFKDGESSLTKQHEEIISTINSNVLSAINGSIKTLDEINERDKIELARKEEREKLLNPQQLEISDVINKVAALNDNLVKEIQKNNIFQNEIKDLKTQLFEKAKDHNISLTAITSLEKRLELVTIENNQLKLQLGKIQHNSKSSFTTNQEGVDETEEYKPEIEIKQIKKSSLNSQIEKAKQKINISDFNYDEEIKEKEDEIEL